MNNLLPSRRSLANGFGPSCSMEPLLSSLVHFERNLKGDDRMEITDEEANAMVKRVIDAADTGRNEAAGVSLVPVHTYIHQLDKTASSQSAIIVPPFAWHWGIVVGPPESQRLFHLLFVHDVGGAAENSKVENGFIRFRSTSLDRPMETPKYIGQTRYDTHQLNALGKAMIREFGNYHRLFWNCQTFAKCYIRLITQDHEAKFDKWISAGTSRLFLCAFLIGTPFPTTSKVKENITAERLICKMESIPEILPTDDKSAQAIAAIYEALRQDPSWGYELTKSEGTTVRPRFWGHLSKLLFRRNG